MNACNIFISMNNETKTQDQTSESENAPINPLLSEVSSKIEALNKAALEAKTQADRLEQLRARELLGATAGGRPDIKLVSEQESPKDYAKRVMSGDIK